MLTSSALAIYFAHHAINGRYGFEARHLLQERKAIALRKQQSLESVLAELRRDIALVSGPVLDRDMVEDHAQTTLGFAYRNDRVLMRTAR